MIAAVDCGTNTIKLLVGDLPEVAVRESRTVRLGQGVDTTGELADEALERAFACLDEYAALIAEHDVTAIRFCATSATRDASNAAVFTDGVVARLGVRPEVLSGDEEAALSYDGAVRNLRVAAEPPVLVVDIGGGSTELVLGPASGEGGPVAGVSLDIGSVRLHERHLHTDPPTSRRSSTGAGSTWPRCAASWGSRGASRRWRPGCWTCRRTTQRGSTSPPLLSRTSGSSCCGWSR